MSIFKKNVDSKQTFQDEQILYEHFFESVQSESPTQIVKNFRTLFFEAKEYFDNSARLALARIVQSRQVEDHFKFVVSHCCYIVIYYWLKHLGEEEKESIIELMRLFDQVSIPRREFYSISSRLRTLLIEFKKTDQYNRLSRLVKTLEGDNRDRDNTNKTLGDLIARYPFLYEHYLLGEDSSTEARKSVLRLQDRAQNNLEINLAQYLTYKARLLEISRSLNPSASGQNIKAIDNPTLLSDKECHIAIQQFIGKVEKNSNYWDLGQNFINQVTLIDSYKNFKSHLYEYLTSSIDPKYGNYAFNKQLSITLANILPESNKQKVTDILIQRTVSLLLNYLIVDNPLTINHYLLLDLITHLGTSYTMGILMKLVLICPKMRPYLEKRLAILFNHYQSLPIDRVPWLVKSLENLNIAFTVYYGKGDLLRLKII